MTLLKKLTRVLKKKSRLGVKWLILRLWVRLSLMQLKLLVSANVSLRVVAVLVLWTRHLDMSSGPQWGTPVLAHLTRLLTRCRRGLGGKTYLPRVTHLPKTLARRALLSRLREKFRCLVVIRHT